MPLSPPFDIRVDIAPDADPDAAPGTWQWLDISSYRRQQADIELNYGRSDESAEVEAADSALTVNLRDGLLSPRNPNSDLYGRVGPNTPIRYRLAVATDDFARTVASGWGTATSGQAWTAGSNFSVSGGQGKVALPTANTAVRATLGETGALDVDVVYSVSLSAVTTGAPWISAVEIRRIDNDNMYRVHTELKPSGVVTVKVVRVLATVLSDLAEDLSTSATYSAGSKVWTRVQSDAATLRVRVWSGLLSDEPTTWDLSVTAQVLEGSGISVMQWRVTGNTNAGTLTASIDDFRAYALVWQGNIPQWSPRWDKSGNDSTVPLTAAGPLRRLGQGADPVQSPLALQLPRYLPGGYWTFEDSAGALSAGSAIPAGQSAVVKGVSFAADDSLPGAATVAKIDATSSTVTGRVTGDSGGGFGFAGMVFVKLASLPAVETTLIEWRTTSPLPRRWAVRTDGGGFRLLGYNAGGDEVVNNVSLFIDAPTEWTAIQLETTQVGSNVNWSLIWNRVGTDNFYAMTGSIAGGVGRLREFYIPGSPGTTDMLFGHVWAGPESLPFVDATFLRVSSGYDGELAADRIRRLCLERGVTLLSHAAPSEPLGRQPNGTFLDLITDAANADMGVLYERGAGLAYLPRVARYNKDAALTLDWANGDLDEAPEPTDDDQRLRNRWVVKRANGSEATAANEASRAKVGLIGDSTEINIQSDSRLPFFASWLLSLSTLDQPRWPSIKINLIANPEMIPQVLGMRIGSRIKIINPKDQVAGLTIELIVEGVQQKIGRHCWTVEFACSPAASQNVGVFGPSTRGSRYGSSSSTVQAAKAPGLSPIVITTVKAGDVWSTTTTGYQLDLGGETVTVTAMSAVTGTGPYVQTATVTRGVNGVAKTIKAGTPVKLAQPARYAL